MVVLVAALLLVALLPSALHANRPSEQAGLQRTASFVRGKLTTSRDWLPQGPPRSRHARVLAEEQHHLWVLGLHSLHDQEQVHLSLKRMGGRMLYALPGPDHLHWLVQMNHEAFGQLLDAHENVTGALFPDAFKLSPAVQAVIDHFRASTADEHQAPPPQVKALLHTSSAGTPPRVTLLVLGSLQHPDQMSALAKQLVHQLNETYQGDCAAQVHPAYPLLEISLCAKDLEAVSGLLAAQPQVTWLDLASHIVWHDLYSVAAMQAGPLLSNATYPAPDVYGGKNAPFYPYWSAGLDGSGEVVGVLDSGLDLDSCYLWDPNALDYLNGPRTPYVPEQPWIYENIDPRSFELGQVNLYLNPDHRKVIMYAWDPTEADATDDKVGHGTHVVSSIVGSAYGVQDVTATPDFATGVVPNARVAFYDMGKAAANEDDALQLSTGSTRQLYGAMKKMQQLGARVISNSWGANIEVGLNYTGARCTVMNAFSWDHDDTLLVFSAGNDGRELDLTDTSGTVTSPATCANVLSVGASDNYVYGGVFDIDFTLRQPDGQAVRLPPEHFLPFRRFGRLVIMVSGPSPRALSEPPRWFQFIGFDSSAIPLMGKEVKAVLSNPTDGCQPLIPGTVTAGGGQVVLVVSRTNNLTCSLSTVLQNVMATPEVLGGVLVYDDLDFMSDELILNTTLPNPTQYNGRPFLAIYMDQQSQSDLARVLQAGLISVTWQPSDPTAPLNSPFENVAVFSSFGSSKAFDPERSDRYYRIKPDLITPGGAVMAGASDGVFTGQMDQCTTRSMYGTSMSAPQAAGAAVMAMQYFKTGFYPSGAASPTNAFDPTNTLIKAVLLAGTEAMRGKSRATESELKPPPSQFQGFGRLSLSRSLPLAAAVNKGWRLQVINNASLSRIGEQHTYEVQVGRASSAGDQYLSIVMVFNDWFVFPSSTVSSVNDIDLVVTGPGSGGRQATYYPNGLTQPDPVNNVEKVLISPAAAGTYQVTITARYLAVDDFTGKLLSQRYSVAVLGPVVDMIASPYNPAFTAAPVVLTPPLLTPPGNQPNPDGSSVSSGSGSSPPRMSASSTRPPSMTVTPGATNAPVNRVGAGASRPQVHRMILLIAAAGLTFLRVML